MKQIRYSLAIAAMLLALLSFWGCRRCEVHTFEESVIVQETCLGDGKHRFTCTVCGYRETRVAPATGHVKEWIVDVAPTCTKDGTQNLACVFCGEIYDTAVVESARTSGLRSSRSRFPPTLPARHMPCAR